MSQPAYTRTAMQQAIREHGPLSAAELAQVLELPRTTINPSMAAARGKYGTQFFRILRYEFNRGRGGREIPIYTLGPGRDAKRPALGREAATEANRRYTEKMHHVIRMRERTKQGRKASGMYAQLMQS